MPTENRSSNTEMVSEMLPCPFCGQQDFLIERLDSDASVVICQGLTGTHEACLARGPVGVTQDEDEEQPGRDKAVELWNARAEQHQGEPVAWLAKTLKGALAGTLGLVRHYNRLNPDLYEGPFPVFRHADPGEVERLSQIIRDLNDERDEIGAKAGRLRAQLAKQEALLDRVVDHAKFWHDHPYAEVVEGIARDYKALSASAEPEAKS